MRYLTALYANEGRMDAAAQMAGKLKRLEPDFTVERLVQDADYPASLLHRAPGLDLQELTALI